MMEDISKDRAKILEYIYQPFQYRKVSDEPWGFEVDLLVWDSISYYAWFTGLPAQRYELTNRQMQDSDDYGFRYKEAKKKEGRHFNGDGSGLVKRAVTGADASLGFDAFHSVQTTDLEVVPNSDWKNYPDLAQAGVLCGQKSVDSGFPVPTVPVNPHWPEILLIVERPYVFNLGFVSIETMAVQDPSDESDDPELSRKFSKLSLIKDKGLRDRKTKYGFHGFGECKTFRDINELRRMSDLDLKRYPDLYVSAIMSIRNNLKEKDVVQTFYPEVR